MSMRMILWTGMLCLAATLISGCFSARPEDLSAFKTPDQADVTGEDYIIQPPDRITIIAKDVPELSGVGSQLGQTQQIRPDGMISYEKIGEIPVAGKTPRQVAELIAQRLAGLYKLTGEHPIDVRVENQSKLYYILGQVRQPGAKIFSGRETTLSAIAKAIPTDYAWKEQIQVIRPSRVEGEQSKIFALDYRKMVIHGQTEHVVLLQEGDIIYVPPTVFSAIGLTVGEILGPIFQGGRAVQMVSGGV
jgi:polysaccharide export outer membrane protein